MLFPSGLTSAWLTDVCWHPPVFLTACSLLAWLPALQWDANPDLRPRIERRLQLLWAVRVRRCCRRCCPLPPTYALRPNRPLANACLGARRSPLVLRPAEFCGCLCPAPPACFRLCLQGKCSALVARLRPELLEEILHYMLLPSPPPCEPGGEPGGIAEACGVHPMLPDVLVSSSSSAGSPQAA